MSRIASLVAVAVLSTACASVPKASPEADALAKEFRTSPGKTNLYVFRDEVLGGAVKMSVALDDRNMGDTAAKTFLVAAVPPGPHALVSKAENDARLDFVAQPGKNVYVWQEVKMGVLMARSRLQLVDEQSARARIEQCSLAMGDLMPPGMALPAAAPTAEKEQEAIPQM